jgi:outer membrane protein assembly factor BamA
MIPVLLFVGFLNVHGALLMASSQEVSSAIVSSNPAVTNRSELLKKERLEKEKNLSPYKLTKLEKRLLSFDTKGFRESLGLRYGDFYFSQGGITTGAGLSPNARYFKANLKETPLDVSLFAAYSFKQYQYYAFQLGNILRKSPDLFLRGSGSGGLSLFDKTKDREGNVFVYAELAYRYFPQEKFYGLGNDSSESNKSDYRLSGNSFEGVGAIRFRNHFGFFVRSGLFQPELGPGKDSTIPSTQELFNNVTAPGLDSQPNFFRVAGQAFYDYRDVPRNPSEGGLYGFTASRYYDQDDGQFNFSRITVDARQYVPLWSEQRVLALRFYTSMDDEVGNSQVPFYLMQTLGGPDSLRGYSNFRFRDKNLFLLSAEYRWKPAPAVELALFYDTGKVFPDTSDYNFKDLKKGYGFGIRLSTIESFLVRFDIGHSVEGTHFTFTGHVSF